MGFWDNREGLEHHYSVPSFRQNCWNLAAFDQSSCRDCFNNYICNLNGWSAYCDLNSLAFNHFTVIHTYAFKTYRNVETQDIIHVHTNNIESAWKHAKDHFKGMSGTRLSQFEGHMAEIMWRSHFKGKVYSEFLNLTRVVFDLQKQANFE